MNALTELLNELERRELDFGMWKDSGRIVAENRYEIRVFGRDDVRVLRRASTLEDAARAALEELRRPENAPSSEAA